VKNWAIKLDVVNVKLIGNGEVVEHGVGEERRVEVVDPGNVVLRGLLKYVVLRHHTLAVVVLAETMGGTGVESLLGCLTVVIHLRHQPTRQFHIFFFQPQAKQQTVPRTRSPFLKSVTPSPVSTSTPAISSPRMQGYLRYDHVSESASFYTVFIHVNSPCHVCTRVLDFPEKMSLRVTPSVFQHGRYLTSQLG
jgi:hypothetical protein